VALVGYTNAGKSTIMNAMIDRFVGDDDKKVLEEDMLFATLDTTVRRINTGNNRDFLLSDTVGFIHKLPHTLVEAFKSTLEEVQNADLLVQVVDYSDPYYREQMETTRQTLAELMAGNIPTITVFNKTDLVKEQVEFPRSGEDRIYISAKDDASLSMLVQMIGDKIYEAYVEAELLIPYDRGGIVSYFRENSHMLSQEYTQEGTRIRVKCHKADKDKYAQFICK
jgi:GTP-binding protein HflX